MIIFLICSLLYKKKNVENQFLVMIWNCYHFKKHNKNLQRIYTLSKIHIYSKMIKKIKCYVLEQL